MAATCVKRQGLAKNKKKKFRINEKRVERVKEIRREICKTTSLLGQIKIV